ncbi:MAG: sigma 54-interacting transcriptional regulator [Planctomycetaceae bacterium]
MLFRSDERAFAEAIRRLAYANPCDTQALAIARREATSVDFGSDEAERQLPPVKEPDLPLTDLLARRSEALLLRLIPRLKASSSPPLARDQELYEDLIVSALYQRYFAPMVDPLTAQRGESLAAIFRSFHKDFQRWTAVPMMFPDFFIRAEHAFAVFFQHRLALVLIHQLLQGNSQPMMRLRASIWHSIFPRELRWYGSLLYERMHDVATLILGPSGTGKELVATAIGLARFVPFDRRKGQFTEPFAGAFHPINLSAMPRDLIESEMFGHVAGAFTGATKNREGWFEKCRRGHTVFLDELGEMQESVQVRLLRVLQSREFYRVGDAEPQRFEGRVIAATNRDLSELIAAGTFREDLYFRLCSDIIRTPTLRELLADSLEELPALVAHAVRRCLGEKATPDFIEQLGQEVLNWIEHSPEIGLTYSWPGNFRELEQCVRSVMVRGEYHPPVRRSANVKSPSDLALNRSSRTVETALDTFTTEVRAGMLTFDELLERYCSLIFSRTDNIAETARRLKKHRATIQARIQDDWVAQFRKSEET